MKFEFKSSAPNSIPAVHAITGDPYEYMDLVGAKEKPEKLVLIRIFCDAKIPDHMVPFVDITDGQMILLMESDRITPLKYNLTLSY